MKSNSTLVWLRNDLRLHDNATLHEASQHGESVFLVYCFDTREGQESALGFCKTEAHRAQFLLQSIAALRESVTALGGSLILRQGISSQVIPQVARDLQVSSVFVSEEAATDEIADENAVEKELWKDNITLNRVWQSTLLHKEDIPWPLKNLPDVFTKFRKESEKYVDVRPLVPSPKQLASPTIDIGELPTLECLGYTSAVYDERSVLPFTGGEKSAWERLNQYFWEEDRLKDYKETRNGLLGQSYSSKLSAWLSLGCISPRAIYYEIKRYEEERTKNQSTYWLFFELLWRDYFRFVAKKYGIRLFLPGGIKDDQGSLASRQDYGLFEKWRTGNTGIPFIDANMRELLATGFMSNRGRQNVASFLVKDLQLDWRWGAAWFEAQLVDYDVCSNWANWNYVAGVGNDPREDRYFNIMSQAKRYDGAGDYVRAWVPELAQIQGGKIHRPHVLSDSLLDQLDIQLGNQYPYPIIDTAKWAN
ncbi:MAG: DASH family cryptochrome [Bacteroidota bacterium]